MNSALWVPISFTILVVMITIIDLWDDWDKFKQQWFLACLVLLVKPGLFIAIVWWIWGGLM